MRPILYTFFALWMTAAGAVAQIDSESEAAVRAAFLDYVEAVNERDVEAIREHYFRGVVSNFDRRGGRLLAVTSEDSDADLGDLIDFDLASVQEIRVLDDDLDVFVYGDSAVVTGYWIGRHRSPGEIADFGAFCFSSVWVKAGGQWREAHRHSSFLQTQQSEPRLRPIPAAPPSRPPAPPPASPPPVRAPSRVRGADMEANLIQRVDPEYPPEARAGGIRGVVVLEIVVKAAGAVEGVRVISGHPLLWSAATEAVQQWRYRSGGTIVDVVTTVTVTFPPEN